MVESSEAASVLTLLLAWLTVTLPERPSKDRPPPAIDAAVAMMVPPESAIVPVPAFSGCAMVTWLPESRVIAPLAALVLMPLVAPAVPAERAAEL